LTGAIVWILLVVAVLGWGVVTWQSGGRLPTFLELVRRIAFKRWGRVVLVIVWAEIGWHLLAQRP
jgi:hypothetical protein